MARYTVIFDRDAHADLSEIRDYIAKARGLEFANAFVERIVSHCESFATIPYRDTRRDAIRQGLRTVSWRRTVTISFEVMERPSRVVILGAFYRGRDFVSVLKQRNA